MWIMYRNARKLLRKVLEHDSILVVFHVIFSKCILYDSLNFVKTVFHCYHLNLDNLSENAESFYPQSLCLLGVRHMNSVFFNLR
jgi:hypothetical protein